MDSSLWVAIIRLIVCLPVVGVLAYLFIKFGMGKDYVRRKGNMEIMEQIALAPKATLSIVKIGKEYLLLSSTEKGISLIKQLDDYQQNEAIELQFNLSEAIKNINTEKGSNKTGGCLFPLTEAIKRVYLATISKGRNPHV